MSTSPPVPQAVLVVDDEPMIRMIARAALTGAGFAVSEAGDSAEAREAVRTAARPFALILLDLTLGGEAGADLIPEFRSASPGSKVLVFSGIGEADPTELGADGFL